MMQTPRNERRRRVRYGRWAEAVCALSLMLRGYRILARRYRTPLGEIDIVARRGAPWVRRANHSRAASVGAFRGRPARFLQKEASLQGLDQRFDVMLVAPRRAPHHIIDTWREWNSAAQ